MQSFSFCAELTLLVIQGIERALNLAADIQPLAPYWILRWIRIYLHGQCSEFPVHYVNLGWSVKGLIVDGG